MEAPLPALTTLISVEETTMADCTYTTPARFSEAALSFQPTPVMQRFAALMSNVAAYIEAERDLEHCNSVDPSCDHWIADAEQARKAVLVGLNTLDAAPVHARHDIPLRRYGQLTRLLIESDNPEDFRAVFALPDRFPHHFRCRGSDRAAARVNLLISAFTQHLNALATLCDFNDPIHAQAMGNDADASGLLISSAA